MLKSCIATLCAAVVVFASSPSSAGIAYPPNASALSVTFPYSYTTGQTAVAASFLGLGSIDANGKFQPLPSSTVGSTYGVPIFQGAGIPGTQAGGLVTIQGDPSGTPVNVNGTVTLSGNVPIQGGTGNVLAVDPSGNIALSSSAAGLMSSTSAPGYLRIQGGSTTALAGVNTTSFLDSTSNSNQGLATQNFNMAFNSSNWDRVRKDSYAAGPLWTDNGGGSTTHACSSNGICSVKSSAGRIGVIEVTTVGTTGIVTCYDNTAASGTVIGGISAANGTLLFFTQAFEMPAATGIYCVSAANGPAYTVSYY